MQLIPVDDDVVRVAARLEPMSLRSLDALHLASALSVGRDLETLLTYDIRLADAAQRHGIAVLAPV